ncbi:MAG: hypothetical protein ACI4MI_02510 [Christensenellales bacterium]
MKRECTDPATLAIFEEVKERAKELYPHYFVDSSYTLYVTDSKSDLGFCITKRLVNYQALQHATNRPKRYIVEIMISKYIIGTPCLRRTIVHEFGHAVTDNSLHDQKWQRRANKIGEKWGITVSEIASHEDSQIFKANLPQPKYVIVCPNCGNTAYRYRRSKIVSNPDRYLCAKCKSKIKVMINDGK